MKRFISAILALLLFGAGFALADTLTTNGSVTLDTAGLPYCTTDSEASVVYYISDISPESLVMMYDVLGRKRFLVYLAFVVVFALITGLLIG